MPKKKFRPPVAPKSYESLSIQYSDFRSVRQPDGSRRFVWVDKRERRQRAAALKAEGLSIREIAEQFGVHYSTISRDLDQFYREQTGIA